jgi:hypothetical protein
LKDLCARLPYDTIINVNDGKYRKDVKLHPHYILDWDAERWDAKPYLRSMSSMTEEEKKKVHYLVESHKLGNCSRSGAISDYLNSIHIDYRGLIQMGLAIEAPEGMYNN